MKKGIYWFMQLVSAAGPRDSSNVGSSLVISVFWLYPDWKAKCQLQFQLYILMDYNPKKKRTFFSKTHIANPWKILALLKHIIGS